MDGLLRFRFDCVFALERTPPLIDLVRILDKDLQHHYLLHAQLFARFQGLLRNEKNISCHSLRTWPISRAGQFYNVAHFPGVIGAIDCTHIRIIYPNKENAVAFVNRKKFYSINVHAVCGSTHDSRIFENRKIADKLREGAIDAILVGDSGYACIAYLMTAILLQSATILHIGVLGVLLRDALAW